MDILFSGKWAIDPETFGVTFEAVVDGGKVVCHVDTDALQDIEPSQAASDPASQFKANQYYFQEIAESLIQSGRALNGHLHIRGSDVRGA